MPPLPEIERWDADLLAELRQQLVDHRFASLQQVVDWLRDDKGKDISYSQVQRFSSTFKKQLKRMEEAAEVAKAVAHAMPDAEGLMDLGLTKLLQNEIYQTITSKEEDLSPKDLEALAKSHNLTARTGIALKDYQQKVKEKAALAAQDIEKTVRQAGLADEAVDLILGRVLGIAA